MSAGRSRPASAGRQDAGRLPSRRWSSPPSRAARRRPMASTPGEIEPDPAFVGPGGWRGRNGAGRRAAADGAPAPLGAAGAPAAPRAAETRRLHAAALAAARGASKASRRRSTAPSMRRSTTLGALDAWIAEAFDAGVVAIDTETILARSDVMPISSACRWRPRRDAPAIFRSSIRDECAARSVRRRASSTAQIPLARRDRAPEAAARGRAACSRSRRT